ncbi:MAG: efflux RND transporter periplasmic adaptor subunit [Candidatus Binatia bacterium]
MTPEQEHGPEHMPEGEEAAPAGVGLMSIVRWGLVVLMAALAVASLVRHAGVFARAGVQEAAVRWQCPMHPSVVSDHPGECPICSMTLVPVKGEPAMPSAASDLPGLVAVDLTPERVRLSGLRTEVVRRGALAPELRAPGVVAAAEDRLVQVHTRVAGWVQDLRVARTGDRVARGDVLASLYSPELVTAQQEYLNARRWAREPGTPSEVGRLTAGLGEDARRRLERLGIAAEEVAAIDRSGRAAAALAIRAPATGWVVRKTAVEGGYVQPGTELFALADLGTVWVLAEVPERHAGRLRPGQAVTLETAAEPGRSWTGTIDGIYPTLDATTRTARVRVVVPNADLRLWPGMYADVRIALAESTGLLVPRDAVIDTGTEQYVFVASGDGRFEPRRVRLGARSGEVVELLEGVQEGDAVVTSANFLIDSESRLRAAVAGLAGGADACADEFDRVRYPEKYAQCRACEVQHRGMGSMAEDCKQAIAKPWR